MAPPKGKSFRNAGSFTKGQKSLRTKFGPLTAEHKKKISDKLKGRMPKNIALLRSPESIKKMAESHKGERHWNYKHGLAKTKEYKRALWRKKDQQRRAREKEMFGSHTFGEWETLKAQYNWTCPMCDKKEPKIQLTEDHIIPISKGGSNNIENIQPLCAKCNNRKYTKIIYLPPPPLSTNAIEMGTVPEQGQGGPDNILQVSVSMQNAIQPERALAELARIAGGGLVKKGNIEGVTQK